MKVLLLSLLIFTGSNAAYGWSKRYCNSVMMQTFKSMSHWTKKSVSHAKSEGRDRLAFKIDKWARDFRWDKSYCNSHTQIEGFINKVDGQVNELLWQAKGKAYYSFQYVADDLSNARHILCRESGSNRESSYCF